jgi:hypothetical protein
MTLGRALVILALGGVCLAQGAPDRAAFMRRARWGVMSHYLADWRARVDREPASRERWNALIDGFDVAALAEQLASTGAGYYLITIGQNSGYYLAPNAAYDRLSRAGESKCARRDLVADLSDALDRRGIKLMVYLPAGAPAGDAAAREALEWRNGAYRNREFQLKWEQVVREWSLRWGRKISGWWFDGCFWPNTMYRTAETPNFASFAAAARAGNPSAALAFNPGVVYRTLSVSPEEDYIAGEIDKPDLWNPRRHADGKIDGAQVHALTYLGQTWGMGEPRFTAEQVAGFSQKVAEAGGVVTWDVPLERGGAIARPFLDQLAAVGRALPKAAP